MNQPQASFLIVFPLLQGRQCRVLTLSSQGLPPDPRAASRPAFWTDCGPRQESEVSLIPTGRTVTEFPVWQAPMTQGFCLYDHGRSQKRNYTDAPSKEQYREPGMDPVLEGGTRQSVVSPKFSTF